MGYCVRPAPWATRSAPIETGGYGALKSGLPDFATFKIYRNQQQPISMPLPLLLKA